MGWCRNGAGYAYHTIFYQNEQGQYIPLANAILIVVVISLATVVGSIIARRVKMTAMPQLVSFTMLSGLASALVSFIEFGNPENSSTLVTILGMVVGSIAFSGSMIAYGKLDGKVGDWFYKSLTYINLLFLALIIVAVVLISIDPAPSSNMMVLFYLLFALSLIYGISFVMPIGGADMPVVISCSIPLRVLPQPWQALFMPTMP